MAIKRNFVSLCLSGKKIGFLDFLLRPAGFAGQSARNDNGENSCLFLSIRASIFKNKKAGMKYPAFYYIQRQKVYSSA